VEHLGQKQEILFTKVNIADIRHPESLLYFIDLYVNRKEEQLSPSWHGKRVSNNQSRVANNDLRLDLAPL